MTGSFVNEKEQKKILTLLYKKRHSGEPVILNKYWKRNIEKSTQIRITLQYLLRDKEYIWCERHREIGNIYGGVKHTLDNVTVVGKITEKGIEYYRKEYRDEFWKYWGLRIVVISGLISALWFVISKIIKS